MKIALINNLYFPFNRGGAEQVVRDMILELQNSGQEVFLITSKPRKSAKLIPPLKLETDQDLKIYYLNSLFYKLDKIPLVFRYFWHLNNLIAFKKYYKIKKILQTTKPDLVITHNLMGLGFLVPQAIKKLKIEHQHILHDIQLLHPSGLMFLGQETKIDSLAAKIYQFFTRQLFASPAKVISPSNWLLNEHLKRGFFQNSSSEVKSFDYEQAKLSQSESLSASSKEIKPQEQSSTNFLFVGQIEKHKGILWLINALKKIDNPLLKLIVVGTGSEIINVKKLAAQDKRIELRGQLAASGVKKIMTESDYLIIPSLCYENAPRVIAEAQALGLPIVAAAIGGIPEIVGPTDQLFKAGNEEDLRNYLLKLMMKKT